MNENIRKLLPHADLRGMDLRDVYGSGFDLCGANLRGADLSGSVFAEGYLISTEAHTKHHLGDMLHGSDFSESDLRGADLRHANLAGCDFSYANLCGAILDGADLTRAILRGAHLSGASLVDASLSGAILDDAHIENANFDRADLEALQDPPTEMPKYNGVRNIPPASVKGTDFHGTDLQVARTKGVDFSSAKGV